ncbi:MAG: alpha-glucan family phosphorylase, partial [Dehalococcoidales bacterium]|nr:alpha-glucan family phosphorylase [Dehalococcoidales bacterium]
RGNFHMTALAMKLANYRNAVSQLHGKTAKKLWHRLWPDVKEEKVPISAITNGIHMHTWVARELTNPYEKYLGKGWLQKQDDPQLWERILDAPDNELWAIHRELKHKLIAALVERAQKRWVSDPITAEQVVAMGVLLDSEPLTIGYCRRFTEYKRPGLIFNDVERLRKIITDPLRPVQIIFAGKSHPADSQGKQLIHEVYKLALDRKFFGRIAFVEDYDTHIAHYLTQGVDVWLNTPRRLQEASGTSGMKAGLNGVLHLSILDGWWAECYNGKNGWAIGKSLVIPDSRQQDYQDARSIYQLLEEEIVPLYYNRDADGMPKGWVRMMKEAIRSIAPSFSARRMMKEYAEQLYLTIAQR